MPKSAQVKLWFGLKVLVLVINCETVGTWYQSRISRTPYPQLGGHAVTGGPKSPRESFDPPNWNMKR